VEGLGLTYGTLTDYPGYIAGFQQLTCSLQEFGMYSIRVVNRKTALLGCRNYGGSVQNGE